MCFISATFFEPFYPLSTRGLSIEKGRSVYFGLSHFDYSKHSYFLSESIWANDEGLWEEIDANWVLHGGLCSWVVFTNYNFLDYQLNYKKRCVVGSKMFLPFGISYYQKRRNLGEHFIRFNFFSLERKYDISLVLSCLIWLSTVGLHNFCSACILAPSFPLFQFSSWLKGC